MFKAFAVFFLLSLIGLAVFSLNKQEVVTSENVEESRGTVLSDYSGEYAVAWLKAPPETTTLIPNFSSKKTSGDNMREYSCKFLVSGGFYSTENSPIGYFVAGGEELSGYTKNKLFNGVLSINRLDTPRITRTPPEDSLVSAVQAGPLIVENGQILEVAETNNKNSRRILAGVTGENNLVFIAVYGPNSVFHGPKLSELPRVISKFAESSGLNFADVINLDGGAASAFLTEETTLSEASPIGSFFCIR